MRPASATRPSQPGGRQRHCSPTPRGPRSADATTWRNFICRSSHPVAAFFHLAFKSGALVLYVLGGWFGVDYVSTFVLSVLLLAFDFWTVKNVTGRLLVGLRWWVAIREDGSNEWLFESAPGAQVPALDYRIFWWTLYAAPAAWAVLGVLALITLDVEWLLVTVVALGLTGACARHRIRRTLCCCRVGAGPVPPV